MTMAGRARLHFPNSRSKHADSPVGWNFVTTAPGYGDGGFFFNATGLQYEFEEIGFEGWLGMLDCHGDFTNTTEMREIG